MLLLTLSFVKNDSMKTKEVSQWIKAFPMPAQRLEFESPELTEQDSIEPTVMVSLRR